MSYADLKIIYGSFLWMLTKRKLVSQESLHLPIEADGISVENFCDWFLLWVLDVERGVAMSGWDREE